MTETVIDLLGDHVAAVIAALRTGLPESIPVGDATPRERDDATGQWGDYFSAPYCFVSGLDGGGFDHTPPAATYPTEVQIPIQVTCVGSSRRQASRVTGRVATILLDKRNVAVPGRRTWRVRWENPSSPRTDPDTGAASLFYATPVFYVHTTT